MIIVIIVAPHICGPSLLYFPLLLYFPGHGYWAGAWAWVIGGSMGIRMGVPHGACDIACSGLWAAHSCAVPPLRYPSLHPSIGSVISSCLHNHLWTHTPSFPQHHHNPPTRTLPFPFLRPFSLGFTKSKYASTIIISTGSLRFGHASCSSRHS